jgi:hypothetical protein
MQIQKKLVSIFLFLCLNCMAAIRNKNVSLGQNQIVPSATIIREDGYKVLGESSSETSTFFILGLFPVTNPLNIEYALSQAVQKIPGGNSMIGVYIWNENQNIFPLGTISVLKVKGTVISFKVEPEEKESIQNSKESPKKKK